MTLRIRRAFEADRLRTILVRGPNWLGDAVLALPTLANLRRSFPAATISLLVRTGVGDLFRASPFIDDVLEIPRWNQLAWSVTALRRRRFDLAVLLPNSFRAALISALAGITNRVGYVTDARWPLLTVGVSASGERSLHQADVYLDLLRAFRWDTWERPLGLTVPLGAVALLLGSPEEARLTRSIRERMRGAVLDLGGRTSLSALASLLGRCRLLLTNDTGAMHLAAAMNVPCVAIFG